MCLLPMPTSSSLIVVQQTRTAGAITAPSGTPATAKKGNFRLYACTMLILTLNLVVLQGRKLPAVIQSDDESNAMSDHEDSLNSNMQSGTRATSKTATGSALEGPHADYSDDSRRHSFFDDDDEDCDDERDHDLAGMDADSLKRLILNEVCLAVTRTPLPLVTFIQRAKFAASAAPTPSRMSSNGPSEPFKDDDDLEPIHADTDSVAPSGYTETTDHVIDNDGEPEVDDEEDIVVSAPVPCRKKVTIS